MMTTVMLVMVIKLTLIIFLVTDLISLPCAVLCARSLFIYNIHTLSHLILTAPLLGPNIVILRETGTESLNSQRFYFTAPCHGILDKGILGSNS